VWAALLINYGRSVLLVALAGFLLVLMANWLNGSLPYVPLLLFAVMLSAWFGGVGPGVLSTALSMFVFATLHFLPSSTFETPNVPRVAFMGGLALVIALLTAAQRRATRDLRESRDALQRNNARLQSEILERVRAMDSLRETNDKLDMIVNNSPLPIIGADAAGRITDWNRAAEEVFGWTAPEAIGNICPTVPQQNLEEYLGMISQAIQGDAFRGLVSYRQKKSGDLRSCRISMAPRRNADNRSIGVTVIVEDITEKRRIEEEILEGRERLKVLSRRLLEAQETERKAVAYELHDELGQVLTAAKISLQAILANGIQDELAARIHDSVDIIESSLQRVRDLSLNLRPWVLDNLGLVPALRWLVDREAQVGKLRGRLVARIPPERYAPPFEIACFRIVQESVTNVLRHAAAAEFEVRLDRTDDELIVTVKDDGAGFDLEKKRAAAAGSSAGLFGIEERAALVGGKAEIETKPGRGTTVRARFPLTSIQIVAAATRRELT
jgi:PAS domain S-box-containing protein